MTVHPIHPTMIEWLYAREVLRRLGFSADDLYFTVQAAGRIITDGVVHEFDGPVVLVSVRAQGLEFNWTIGAMHMSADEIEKAYGEACEMWNAGVFGDDGFFSSAAFGMRMELVRALAAKGFHLSSGWS